MGPETLTSSDMHTDKDMSCNENKGVIVNTVKTNNKTLVT